MSAAEQPRSPNRAIAAIAYTVMRDYRMALGEVGGPQWEAAPEVTKLKVLMHVDFVRSQPEPPTPEFLHRHWVSARMIDGWKQGPRSDALKLHPHMVPFDQLPRDQQAKSVLFLSLVGLLAPLVLALDRAEDHVQQVARDSITEQTGALLFITAMVNRFGGETGIVHLSKNDMHAALKCELMRHDTEDEGLILKVQRPGQAQAKDPAVLDASLPAGG